MSLRDCFHRVQDVAISQPVRFRCPRRGQEGRVEHVEVYGYIYVRFQLPGDFPFPAALTFNNVCMEDTFGVDVPQLATVGAPDAHLCYAPSNLQRPRHDAGVVVRRAFVGVAHIRVGVKLHDGQLVAIALPHRAERTYAHRMLPSDKDRELAVGYHPVHPLLHGRSHRLG